MAESAYEAWSVLRSTSLLKVTKQKKKINVERKASNLVFNRELLTYCASKLMKALPRKKTHAYTLTYYRRIEDKMAKIQ